jgi:hypothetical protein
VLREDLERFLFGPEGRRRRRRTGRTGGQPGQVRHGAGRDRRESGSQAYEGVLVPHSPQSAGGRDHQRPSRSARRSSNARWSRRGRTTDSSSWP